MLIHPAIARAVCGPDDVEDILDLSALALELEIEMATWTEARGKRGGMIAKNEHGRILYGEQARRALANTHARIGKNALGKSKPGFAGVGQNARKGKPKMVAASTKPKQQPQGPPKPKKPRQPAAPRPGQVRNVSPANLTVDPERFQFKLNTDKSGVTDELKQVRTWNPDFAGVLAVWRDPADGRDYVVNGHHRHELASRLGVDKIAVRHIQAGSAKEARAIGALVNMAEGRGTAVDAAKFLRDSGLTLDDMAGKGISLKGKVAADAAALTNLSDRQFNKLARGLMDEGKALAVARHLKDHDLQDQLFALLDKREDEGKDISMKVIEEMAREMASTPTKEGTPDLFGNAARESLFVERNELKAHVRNELAKEVGDFAAVASKRRAERVAGAGNTLNIGENKQRATDAEQAKAVYDTLVNRKGAISDALDTAAEKFGKAKTRRERDAAKEEAVKAVREAIAREADGGRKGEGAGGGRETRSQSAGNQEADDAGRGTPAQTRLTPEKSAQVAKALKRFEERDSLPAAPGAGLFGGDDRRSREGFGKLPEGAEVAIVDGKRKGEVGKIRHETSLDGSKRVVVQIGDDEHTTPVSHDAVEPLNDLHSWRTPLGAGGKKQGSLLDGGGEYKPQQQGERQKAVSAVASEVNALAQSGAASGKVRGYHVTPVGIGRYKVTIKGQTLEGDGKDVAGWIHAAGDAKEDSPTQKQPEAGKKEPWQMTRRDHREALDQLRPNAQGTGGDSRGGMGRSTSEKGLVARSKAIEEEKARLMGGHPPTVWRRFDENDQPYLSHKRPQKGDHDYEDATETVNHGAHRKLVEAALAAGKKVPAEVLADYPDLGQ